LDITYLSSWVDTTNGSPARQRPAKEWSTASIDYVNPYFKTTSFLQKQNHSKNSPSPGHPQKNVPSDDWGYGMIEKKNTPSPKCCTTTRASQRP